jgi:hypothetical protein
MIQTKEKIIDGKTIMVTQFAGRRAVEYKARLIKLLGSSFARLFTADMKFAFSAFTEAIDALTDRIQPGELVNFMQELLQSSRIEGKEITATIFDSEFAGNMPLLYKILWFVLEVNYGSFFGEAGIGKALSGFIKPKSEMPAK